MAKRPRSLGPMYCLQRGLIGEVFEIRYKHAGNGEDYEHEFGPGVKMVAMDDGSLRIYKPRSTVWSDL